MIDEKLKARVIEMKTRGSDLGSIKIALKEILQDYILAAIYTNSEFRNLKFIGGTALRKLYSLNRLSEDIDLASPESFDLEKLKDSILSYFKNLDYNDVDASTQSGDLVYRIIVKFPILNRVGLSGYENEKLHVKVELTHTKEIRSKVITKNLANTPVVITSYPIELLMSGKVLACIDRTYKKGNTGIQIKGRDFYDLVWYMEQSIVPDEAFILAVNPTYTLANVFKILDAKVDKITESDLLIDLESFFENKEAIQIWCSHFHELYANSRKNYNL